MSDEKFVGDDVMPSATVGPLRWGDLPKPIGIRRMIGPSVILLGAAIGSGEFVLWPHIVSHWGFGLWWACMIGLFTQFWVNMEIERYTLATGESAVIGFVRMWKHWAWVFLLCNTIPWVFPGWAKGAAECLSFLAGGEFLILGAPVTVIYAVASMLIIGLVLSLGPVVYKTVERLQLVMVVAILLFVLVLFVGIVKGSSIREMAAGTVNFGYVPDAEDFSLAMLLGAIAYAGAGGSLNLSQSNYVKDKSYGMGAFIGRITSLVTGRAEPIPDAGFLPRQTPENAARWRAWWRAANWEHFVLFFLLGAVSLIMLSCIAHSTVFGLDLGEKMDFVRQEGVQIGLAFGSLARTAFYVAGTLILLTTELGLMDMVARVSADVVRCLWAKGSATWTLRRLYYVFLWGEILVGCAILLAGVRIEWFRNPVHLLVLGASLNGLVMAFYSFLLLWMNGRVLPRWLAMGKVRFIALVWACAFYGYFAVTVLRIKVPQFVREVGKLLR